jgi:hypothetical protein
MTVELPKYGPALRCDTAVWRLSLLSAALALTALGCGGRSDDYPREPISGTVTLDGKPIERGYITFEPKSGQPTQSGGMIEQGKYEVPVQSGAVPGAYSVAVFAEAAKVAVNASPGTPEYEAAAKKVSSGNPVPAKYNFNSILKAEVKAGEPNVFNFELTSK